MYKFEACKEMISKFEDLREEIILTIENIVKEEGPVDVDVTFMRVGEDSNEWSGYNIVEEEMKKVVNTDTGVKVEMTLNYPVTEYDSEDVSEDIQCLSMDELYKLLEGMS